MAIVSSDQYYREQFNALRFSMAVRRSIWNHSLVLPMCQVDAHSDLPLRSTVLYHLSNSSPSLAELFWLPLL